MPDPAAVRFIQSQKVISENCPLGFSVIQQQNGKFQIIMDSDTDIIGAVTGNFDSDFRSDDLFKMCCFPTAFGIVYRSSASRYSVFPLMRTEKAR